MRPVASSSSGRHRVVIVGGGFGGLNVAGAVNGADVDVTVVDRTNHHLFQPLLYQVATGILPPGLIAPALRSALRKQGNARVLLADVRDIDLARKVVRAREPDGRFEELPYDTLVVAAGATHSLLAEKAGVDTDRAGRLAVNPDCTLPGYPEVFAIGNMVSLNKLPGVAQPALQEGKYVGKVIKARLTGESVAPFRYLDKGTMATIGYKAAVADAFSVKVTGPLAYLMWLFIHVLYLVGWGNRVGTIYTWARAFLLVDGSHLPSGASLAPSIEAILLGRRV
jgi:NADH:ubiquinone reductase (H+-translocating)